MLLNVGVHVSAIQFIVLIFPIDAIDRLDPRRIAVLGCWEHDAALQSSGRSSLRGSADLVRKIGSDHETALCNILLRFET
jgi:hypothetical protein